MVPKLESVRNENVVHTPLHCSMCLSFDLRKDPLPLPRPFLFPATVPLHTVVIDLTLSPYDTLNEFLRCIRYGETPFPPFSPASAHLHTVFMDPTPCPYDASSQIL